MNGELHERGRLFCSLRLEENGIMFHQFGPVLVYRGDDWDAAVVVVDDENKRVDITGAVITVTVRPEPGGTGTPTIEATATPRAQTGDNIGIADFSFSRAQTDQQAQLYWFDVVIVKGGKRQHLIDPTEFTIANPVKVPAP